jgi:hypothetical protein
VKSKEERRALSVLARRFINLVTVFLNNLMKRLFTRGSAANALMIAFIIMTTVGAWQIYPPVGLLVGGVGCGIFGFILGLE